MLKHVKSLTLNFAPTSPLSKSIRSFLYLVHNDKNKQSNPKCTIKLNCNDSIPKPTINIEYNDKKKLDIDASYLSASELVADMNRHSKGLQLEEEIRNSA